MSLIALQAAAGPLALFAGGDLSIDRALASWSILAVVLLFACVVMFFQWRHGRWAIDQQGQMLKLFGLAERIVASTDRDEILRESAEAAVEAADADHCFILLPHPSGHALYYAAGTDSVPRKGISMGAISGSVACFRSRETTEVPDADNCPFIDKDLVRRRKQRAVLYAPLMNGETCLGVVEVEDRRRKRNFSAEQRARIEYIARMVALGLRMSDQRAMTEQIHRSEKLSAVGELAQVMSQELAEPFERIQTLAERVPYGLTPRELEERLQDVSSQIDRASSAVEKLVRFAKPDGGDQEEVDLNALLRRLVADMRRRRESKDVQVKLALSKHSPLLFADPTHLQQVFQILLRHAQHYLEDLGGKSLQVNTTLRERRVVVSISPLARPDQPLRSTLAGGREIGSNLGLSVCQSLIERAGGALQIDRQSSLGFQIEVEYPLTEDPFQAGSGDDFAEVPVTLRPSSMTVLIIDPDPNVQRELVERLSEQSYRAVPVSTGEQGIELCQRIRFEWVFCDLRLHPVTAAEVWDRIRDRCERFILLIDESANSQGLDAYAGDGRAVLRKPFTAEDVEALIESLLRSSVIFQDG
ncbi:MAG: GAF domain-containing protein [Acidobacteria bacterium]|nr:GAF domain-containing protein [Acidobacteriota bacterium]